MLASGRLSNEDLFNLKALADQVGGKAVLYSNMGGGDLTSLVGVGQGTNLGEMAQPRLNGQDRPTIVVVASDLYEEAPIWYLRVKQAAERGATLIVANPRETKLDRYASFVVRYAYGDEVKTVQDLDEEGQDRRCLYQSRERGDLVRQRRPRPGRLDGPGDCLRPGLNDTGHVGKPTTD